MATIEFRGDDIHVDASVIGEGLGMTPAAVQEQMRAGTITSLCERGVDADAGRFRLTFRSPERRLRLVVDAQGNLLRRSVVAYSKPPGA